MTPPDRFARTAALLAAAACLVVSGARAQTEKPDAGKPAAKPDRLPTARGGRDRWQIKTASDAEAQEIAAAPVSSTIENLLAIPRPLDMPPDGSNPFFQQHRARPAETTVFSVEAEVVDCRLMPDGDYRVTVRGATGKTLVLEMPHPGPDFVDPQSKFAGQIKTARDQFDAKFHPERAVKPAIGHARITGVGFFGRTYGAKKPDGNMIQLHPVLNIEWLEKPTADFTAHPAPAVKPPAKSPPAPPVRATHPAKRKPGAH